MDTPVHHNENAWQALRRTLKDDTVPSFTEAVQEARARGNYKPIVFKTLGVGVGAALMADGVYNFITGSQEQVEDALFSDDTHRNYVRMVTGLSELGAGAFLLYIGLTKNGLSKLAV